MSKRRKTKTPNQSNRNHSIFDLRYAAVVAFAVGFVVFFIYRPLTIGSDVKYTLFIKTLPVVIGIIIFLANWKKLIEAKAFKAQNFLEKVGSFLIFLLAVSLLSYVTIGLVADVTFEYFS